MSNRLFNIIFIFIFSMNTSFVFARTKGGECPGIAIVPFKEAVANEPVTIIDVNGRISFANGHIPGALDYRVIKDDLSAHLPHDKGELIVVYGGGPYDDSYKYASKAIMDLGYTEVRYLLSGLSGWIIAGEKLEK